MVLYNDKGLYCVMLSMYLLRHGGGNEKEKKNEAAGLRSFILLFHSLSQVQLLDLRKRWEGKKS